MPGSRTIYEIIAEVVRKETRYLRHYEAQVVDTNDRLNKGRVRVTVPALARFETNEGIWAFPRYPNRAQVTPRRGDWVELYFMNGRIERPVYLFGVSELRDTKLENYTAPETIVLYDHPDGKFSIVYNESEEQLSITVNGVVNVEGFDELNLAGASESYVLGDSLKTYLDNLKSYIDTHVHTGVSTGGGSSGPPGSPSPTIGTVLSSKIKGE